MENFDRQQPQKKPEKNYRKSSGDFEEWKQDFLRREEEFVKTGEPQHNEGEIDYLVSLEKYEMEDEKRFKQLCKRYWELLVRNEKVDDVSMESGLITKRLSSDKIIKIQKEVTEEVLGTWPRDKVLKLLEIIKRSA